ncbi:MAG: hypothetical protein HY568_01090 [Candidatus Latescibacteria bacterium]|nr:hypothetical protein [Candidatus Latescibacterota bacterium]
MSAVLLSRLKITDLTAWTALETGRRLLGRDHTLDRLAREQLFLFEPEAGGNADVFEGVLGEAVRHSNFFVNPNKESYRFLASSERGAEWRPPEGAWGILTRSRDDTRDEGLLQRLLREHPLRGLGAIRKARVWWLWTRGPGGGPDVGRCYAMLGVLRDSRTGLLVNPHGESALLIEGAVRWEKVERFLIEPAPAFRDAA